MALVNCTVAGNEASINPRGGGLYSAAEDGEGPIVRNSLFADNVGPPSGDGPDIYGHVQSRDYNLIESTSGYTLSGVTDHTISGRDPDLGPLMDNGGGTPTHALRPGSPAIDAGSCADDAGAPVVSDQRGVPRPQGLRCDIGAYEAQPYLALTKTVDNGLPQPGERITYTVTVENSGAADATGGVISDTLPAGVTLAGPIVLDPPTAGITGALPRLVTGLIIPSGEEVRASFPVTISIDLSVGTTITNTASVTSTEVGWPVWGTRRIVVTSGPAESIYLPLVVGAYP